MKQTQKLSDDRVSKDKNRGHRRHQWMSRVRSFTTAFSVRHCWNGTNNRTSLKWFFSLLNFIKIISGILQKLLKIVRNLCGKQQNKELKISNGRRNFAGYVNTTLFNIQLEYLLILEKTRIDNVTVFFLVSKARFH